MLKRAALCVFVLLLLCGCRNGEPLSASGGRPGSTETSTSEVGEADPAASGPAASDRNAPERADAEASAQVTATEDTTISGDTGAGDAAALDTGAGNTAALDTGAGGDITYGAAASGESALAVTGPGEREPWMETPGSGNRGAGRPGSANSGPANPGPANSGSANTGPANPGARKPVTAEEAERRPKTVKITISAAGDCTLGGDLRSGPNGFMQELSRQENDYTYFLRNVYPVFRKDDLTIANMEGTFASAGPHKGNEFIISGPPELVEVFHAGGVDVVTIANNHTMDYLQKGYEETVAVLDEAGLPYFGNEYTVLIDVKGIKVGLFGYSMPHANNAEKQKIAENINSLRAEGADIVIAYYHWGIEREYAPNANQIQVARHTIDSGADLVLGSHPHVLQGIEEYKGKNIVYSLGNFCFGANRDPFDKDTMIYQHTFVFSDGELAKSSYRIIPCSISSVKDRNNYQPTLLEGAEAERVLAKIDRLSNAL